MTEDIAGVDFAGVDNTGGNRRRWTMAQFMLITVYTTFLPRDAAMLARSWES